MLRRLNAACAVMLAAVSAMSPSAGQLVIDSDFEGASVRVLEVNQDEGRVVIMPGGDPQRGWPAWWCFRATQLSEGQSLTVRVMPSLRVLPAGRSGAGQPLSARWALPDQAAWSTDGTRWKQTEPGSTEQGGMTYRLTAVSSDMFIAWGPLATPSTMNEWLDQSAASHDFVQTFELATTLENRPVRGIRIASGIKPINARPVVWIHARQHAWESGSSWVARGVGDWMTGSSPAAIRLRDNALIYIVPIMDVDRVTTGDGGKESVPHDHNRDWSDDPRYPEVAAVQNRIRQWVVQDRFAVFVDLHNPGPGDDKAYFFVAPDEVIDKPGIQRRDDFLNVIDATWDANIPFDRTARSTGPGYHPLWQQISSNWVTRHTGDDTVAVCLETAWNTPHSSTDGYRSVGASLGRGISRFLGGHSDQPVSNE